jgi:hypothetical protein
VLEPQRCWDCSAPLLGAAATRKPRQTRRRNTVDIQIPKELRAKIPQLGELMIAKERGARTAAALTVLIFPLAFLIGGVLNRVLQATGWGQ